MSVCLAIHRDIAAETDTLFRRWVGESCFIKHVGTVSSYICSCSIENRSAYLAELIRCLLCLCSAYISFSCCSFAVALLILVITSSEVKVSCQYWMVVIIVRTWQTTAEFAAQHFQGDARIIRQRRTYRSW